MCVCVDVWLVARALKCMAVFCVARVVRGCAASLGEVLRGMVSRAWTTVCSTYGSGLQLGHNH